MYIIHGNRVHFSRATPRGNDQLVGANCLDIMRRPLRSAILDQSAVVVGRINNEVNSAVVKFAYVEFQTNF